MSGPQFIHVETYATSVSKLRVKRELARAEEGKPMDRKLTLEQICKEAGRVKGHHDHVLEARPPVLLFGVRPEEVPAIHATRVAEANMAIKNKKAGMARGTKKGGPRAIRPDTHTGLTMVASYPKPWLDQATGKKLLDDPDEAKLFYKWQALNIEWAKLKAATLGFELISVVRHDDEGHPHLHFICLPTNERMEARACHPGYIAKDGVDRLEGEDDKALKRRLNAAYNNAMRAFQDDYFDAVGKDSGLLRLGPKRKRLTNSDYKSQRTIARSVGLANVRADELAEQNKVESQKLEETKSLYEALAEETVEALVLSGDLQGEQITLEGDLKKKRAEAADLDDVVARRIAATTELSDEIARLSEAKLEREEAEADAASIRAENERQRNLLAEERKAFDDRKRKYEAKAEENERSLAAERETLNSQKADLDTLIEGVEAFGSGLLRYNPGSDVAPLSFTRKQAPEVVERFKMVKPTLVPIIARLDEAFANRLARMHEAVTEALAGWSKGLLQGLGDPRPDGQPTFIIPESDEGNALLHKIKPFREAVGRVIAAMPDPTLIKSVKQALERLRPHLTAAGEQEALTLARDEAIIQERAAKQRD